MDNPKCPHCNNITLTNARDSWDLEEFKFCTKCLRRFECKVVIEKEIDRFQDAFNYIC